MSAAVPAGEFDEADGGAPHRHIDACTARLDMLARSWIDVQQTRKALAQRELDDGIVAAFAKAEAQLSAALSRTLRQHVLWPWLSQFPGLGGAHTALIIGRIGDPRRFPGQRCSAGHYLPPLYAAGTPCPITGTRHEIESSAGDGALDARADEASYESDALSVCPGLMLPPRTTTGVRSLWHYAGLAADTEGRAPRKRKGQKCDWDPRVRASVMQPGGIAEQIVRLNVPVFVDRYRAAKATLILRVPDLFDESDQRCGDANQPRAAESLTESESAGGRPLHLQRTPEQPREIVGRGGRPLKLHEADRIAKKIAAKAFLGDLLTEWKRLAEGAR